MKLNLANNEQIQMTRRYPDLPRKVLQRDSVIANKIMLAWNTEQNPQRVLNIYLNHTDKLSDERYWELMRTVWILVGSVENAPLFRKLMQANRKEKYYFSTPEEAKELREMPERFEVYRATNYENDGGLSWTTSLEYAKFYAQQYGKSQIIKRIVNRKEVFAYINRNKESEILIL